MKNQNRLSKILIYPEYILKNLYSGILGPILHDTDIKRQKHM